MPEEIAGAGTAAVADGAGAGTEVVETPPGQEVETPTEGVETEVVETPPEETETPTEGEEEDLLGDIDADGRKTDAATRKQIADLKKTNPEIGKKWADDHFHRKAFETEFPGGVREARQTKAILESLGGEEGIGDMQSEVEDYRNEIQQFSQGDPALLAQLQEANPESFVTAMQNGLELLAGRDLKQFDTAIIPAMVTRLDKAGMFDSADSVLALIKEGKGQEAYDLQAKVVAWLRGAKDHASKNLETKSARDPEREAISRERAEVQTEKQKMYTESVTGDVNRMNAPVLSRITMQLFKDLKLPEKGRNTFKQTLESRIWKAMGEDKAYLRAAKAIRAKGDRVRHARFVHDKFREMLPEQFRALRNEMYPSLAKRTAAPAATARRPAAPGANGKAPVVAAPKPVAGKVYKRAEVDIERTPSEYIILGKAYLKGSNTPVPYER
jgi:hypothetical protein